MRSKILVGLPKFGQFWGFWSEIIGQKIDFSKLPFRLALGARFMGQFSKIDFWPKISLQKPQNWPNFRAGPKFLNPLYFTKEMRLVDAVLSGISAALFGVVIWAIFTDNRERVLMRELPQRRIVFQLLVCLGVLNFMFVFAQHIQRGLQTGDNKKKTVESLKISGKFWHEK